MVRSSVTWPVDPRGRKPREASPPSTEEIVVDGRYVRLLAEDLGVEETTAHRAFIGEPQKRALGVVAWAFDHAPDNPGKRAKLILMWAKKREAGAYRKQGNEDAEREIARRIARYWSEHPDSLAETLREAMNGRGS
jgi:hypothetical protein